MINRKKLIVKPVSVDKLSSVIGHDDRWEGSIIYQFPEKI